MGELGRTSPELTFSRYADADLIRIGAVQNGKRVGDVTLTKGVVPGALVMQMAYVDPSARSEHVGTRLYERALEEACSRGERLVSDSMRSPFAEAFWRKQVNKGRATCLELGRGGVYSSPMRDLRIRLRAECNRTHPLKADACADARFKAMTALLPRPQDDAWPCYRWTFKPDRCGTSLEGPGPSGKSKLGPLLLGALFVLPLIPP